MNIGTIYTLYNRRAGAELFCERILEDITDLRKDIKVIVFCNSQAFEALKHNKNISLRYIKFLNDQYMKAIWLELFSKKYINKKNFDLFWIPSGANSFPGRWNIPVVTTIHDIGECRIPHKYGFIRTIYRIKISLPRSLGRSDRVIAVSNAASSDIIKIFKYPKPISVIYEAAYPWHREVVENPGEVIKEETGKSFTQIVLCVGRIDFISKGIDIVVDGYRRLLKENPGMVPPLVFAGPRGEKSSLLCRLIRKQRLQGQVFYLGRVSNRCLESLYSIALVNILASRHEGFGLTVLESLERGLPVLAPNLEVIREISGDAPIFFNVGNVEDFAKKLLNILEGKIDMKNNIELGLNIASRYSWQMSTKEYVNIFDSLITGKKNEYFLPFVPVNSCQAAKS